MKILMIFNFVLWLLVGTATAQANKATPDTQEVHPSRGVQSSIVDDDRQQLSSDLQQLKVLLNQMRTNLAFVQTSPTPLKHQFEIEADAWEVIVRQMEQRLQKMERREDSKPRN
jgi:hypothetical protein